MQLSPESLWLYSIPSHYFILGSTELRIDAYHIAAREGNLKAIMIMSSKFPYIGILIDGQLAQEAALDHNHEDIYFYFIYKMQFSTNQEIIYKALEQGYVYLIKHYLTQGIASIQLLDDFGNTLLHRALMHNNLKSLKLLLSFNQIPIRAENLQGRTVWHMLADSHVPFLFVYEAAAALLSYTTDEDYEWLMGSNLIPKSHFLYQTVIERALPMNVSPQTLSSFFRSSTPPTNIPQANKEQVTAFKSIDAVERCNPREYIEEFLKDGNNLPQINTKRLKRGDTLCHLITAIYNQTFEPTFKLLLDHKMDLNIQNDNEDTPLHMAIKRGNETATRALIKAGANLSIKNKFGQTVFHLAAISPVANLLELLLTHIQEGNDSNRNMLEAQDMDGNTPLHLSLISHNKVRNYQALIQKGVNFALCNKNGVKPINSSLGQKTIRSLLNMAISSGNINLLNAALDAGANPNHHSPFFPLHHVLIHYKKDLRTSAALALINNKADYYFARNDGKQAIHLAVIASDNEVLNAITNKDNINNINAQDKKGYTPLYYAISRNNSTIINFLIEKGANPLICSKKGESIIEYAYRQHPGLIKTLLCESGNEDLTIKKEIKAAAYNLEARTNLSKLCEQLQDIKIENNEDLVKTITQIGQKLQALVNKLNKGDEETKILQARGMAKENLKQALKLGEIDSIRTALQQYSNLDLNIHEVIDLGKEKGGQDSILVHLIRLSTGEFLTHPTPHHNNLLQLLNELNTKYGTQAINNKEKKDLLLFSIGAYCHPQIVEWIVKNLNLLEDIIPTIMNLGAVCSKPIYEELFDYYLQIIQILMKQVSLMKSADAKIHQSNLEKIKLTLEKKHSPTSHAQTKTENTLVVTPEVSTEMIPEDHPIYHALKSGDVYRFGVELKKDPSLMYMKAKSTNFVFLNLFSLVACANKKNVQYLELLDENGFKWDTLDDEGHTALARVVRNNDLAAVNYIVNSVGLRKPEVILFPENILYLACRVAKKDVFKTILEKYPKDLINQPNIAGETLILICCEKSKCDKAAKVGMLLEAGADINHQIVSKNEDKILHCMVNKDVSLDISTLKKILEHSATEIAPCNKMGNLPLHNAILEVAKGNGRGEECQKLKALLDAYKLRNKNPGQFNQNLDFPFKFSLKNPIKATPLLLAISQNNATGVTVAVKMLLEAKANPNRRGALAKICDGIFSSYQYTPLQLAVEKGYFEVVRLLVESKADLSAKNKAGQDALGIAKSQSCENQLIVEFLQEEEEKKLKPKRI